MAKVTYNRATAQKMAQMQINLPIQNLVQFFVQTVMQFRLQNTVQFSMQNNLQKSVQSSVQIVVQKKWHRCKSVADFGTDVGAGAGLRMATRAHRDYYCIKMTQ